MSLPAPPRPAPADLLRRGNVTVQGKTRSGKTEFALWHARRPEAPGVQVFWDNKRDTHLPEFHTLDFTDGRPPVFDARTLLDYPRLRIVPPDGADDRKELARSFSSRLRAVGARWKGARAEVPPWCLVLWDEAYMDSPPGDVAGGAVSNLAAQGVGLGIRLWSLFQHASTIGPTAFSQRAYWVLFNQEPGNYLKLRSNHGVDVPTEVRAHVAQRFHFAVWDGDAWSLCIPLPLEK